MLQYVSDLHLEYYPDDVILSDFLTPCSPNLLLLGDIGHPKTDEYKSFIYQASRAFENVFVILGNHEYYHDNNIDIYIRTLFSKYSNVYLLQNEAIETNDFIILGTTLWTSASKYSIPPKDSDFEYIPEWNIAELNKRYNLSLNWLDKTLKKYVSVSDKPIIVCSHHMPSYLCVSEKFKSSPYNCFYVSDLNFLIKEYPIKYWLCGHGHESLNLKIHSTQILSNPRGYAKYRNGLLIEPYENKYYNKEACIS